MTPPRLARRVLAWCASRDDRDSLLGELDAECARIAATEGPDAARRWYRRQARGSAWPLLTTRVRAAVARRWLSGGIGVDLTQGVRNIVRQRTVSAVVVFTLGVASAAALASVVVLDAVLLSPLPFPEADRLVRLWSAGPTLPANIRPVSFQDLEDWRESSTSLAALSAFTPISATLTGRGETRRLEGMRVARDFDRVLGVRPAHGRLFIDQDFWPGAEPVVVVTYAWWQREFPGESPSIQTLTLDGQPRRIVGVLQPMSTPFPTAPHNFWMPLVPRESARWELSRSTGWIDAVGRLRPAITVDDAERELSAVAQRLSAAYPESNRERPAMTVVSLHEDIVGDARPALLLVAVATFALLVVAIGNVLQLVVAQGIARRPEFSVRHALGAGRGRLARQAGAEAFVLAALAVAAGLALAPVMLQALRWLPDSAVPRRDEIAILPNAVAWAVGLFCVTVLAIGAPMLRAALRSSVSIQAGSARSTGTRADRRARYALVACQVGFSVVLILGGVVFVQTLQRLEAVDLGFSPDQVVTLQPTPSRTAAPSANRTLAFYSDTLDRVAALPGVTHVAASTSVPFVVGGWAFSVSVPDGGSVTRHLVRVTVASPRFFDTLGMRVIEGRALTDEEHRQGQGVAVVSHRLARLLFGDKPASGESLDYSGTRWRIAGVVADVRTRAGAPPDAALYLPWHNAGQRPQAVVVRTASADQLDVIGQRIREIDPDATIAEAGLLRDRVRRTLAPQRFRAGLLASLAALAALLALVGAYSVTTFAVASQRREQAIRLALGERVDAARRRVVLASVRPAAAGAAAGVGVAWYGGRFIDSFLYESSLSDPRLLLVPLAILACVAMAALVPSARLARLNPASVFRPDERV